jgi:hypothetical protein
MDAETLRGLLVIYLVLAYVAAVLYLRRRRMPFGAYAFWGFFAMLIPAFGPFVVIALQPGQSTRGARRRSRRRGR